MDNKIHLLEERYWAGETTLQEELLLKQAALANDADVSDSLKSLFALANENSLRSLNSSFESDFWQAVEAKEAPRGKIISFNATSFFRYAAVGILLVAFSFAIGNLIFKFNANPAGSPDIAFASLEDTYDNPEQAFLEMKRALMFASYKLNKGVNPVKELKRFDEGMNSVQLSH